MPAQPSQSDHAYCTDKAPCGRQCPHWDIALSDSQLDAIRSLPLRPAPDVPIYKGLESCPYCGVEVDERMVERAISALAVVPRRAETNEQDRELRRKWAVHVLKAALHEDRR